MFAKVEDAIDVKGLENIPKDGVNIFLANHQCILDVFLIPFILKRPCISLVSTNSLFGTNEKRKRKLNDLLYPFPVETRADKKYINKCLSGAIKLLQEKKDLVIFPQGVFDNKTTISKARTGAARILFNALEKDATLNINIIPISIKMYTNNINPQSSEVEKDYSCTVNILSSFNYKTYYNAYKSSAFLEKRNEIMHKFMDDVMLLIAKDLKVPFTNTYKIYMRWKAFGFQVVNL